MRQLLGRFLRLAALASSGLCTAAVLLGRLAPADRDGPPALTRSPAVPRYHGVSDLDRPRSWPVLRVLDAETGALSPCSIPGPGLVGLLGCSPWRDAAGQFHLIARVIDTAGDPRGFPAGDVALARYTYPAGRLLGRFAPDRVPRGAVCWSPDRGDRILFAAGDGRLYRHDLPPGVWPGTAATSPRPIRWGCGPPGAGGVFLQDPCWPAGPYAGGWLLAAVRVRQGAGRPLSDPRLWWLKLDPEAGVIVEARRAIAPEGEGSADAGDEESLPGVGAASDGSWHLVYLVRRRGLEGLELRVAPLAAGASDGGPRGGAPPGRKLASGCVPWAPAFSPDGRWVYASVADGRDGVRIERWSVRQPEDVPSDPMPIRGRGVPADASAAVDGALFGFVHATDPEILPLIEARPAGGSPVWRYGLARMSGYRLRVWHKDRVVWEAGPMNGAYTNIPAPEQPD